MIVLHKKDILNYLDTDPRLKNALLMIAEGAVEQQAIGRTDDSENMYHNIQRYFTKPLEETCYESHQHWIDIQYIRSGEERIDVRVLGDGAEAVERNETADYIIYRTENNASDSCLFLKAGMLAVFYPEDLHRPCICAEGPQLVEKVVFKIRV